jgi:hypothetical protein
VYDEGPVPDKIEQGQRKWEEGKLWNTAECPYFFFPKEKYYLATVDKQLDGGVEDIAETESNQADEEGALQDHGRREGLLINFEDNGEEIESVHGKDLRELT